MTLLVIFALFGLVALPGALLFSCLAGRPRRLEDAVEAMAVGHALAFLLLWLCATLDLWLFTRVAAALAVVAGVMLIRSSASPSPSPSPPLSSPSPPSPGMAGLWSSPETRWLAALLLLWLGLRTIPLLVNPHPRGWDPYFHMILAEKVERAGGLIDDWEPFEPIRLNYPLGLHLLLAWTRGLSGAPLTLVFNVAMVVFTLGNALGAFAAVSRATASREVAAFSAAVYAFWAQSGGLEHTLLGQPQAAAPMYLLLAAVSLLMRADVPQRAAGAGIGVLLGGIVHTHHHAALAAALVMGGVGVIAALRRDWPLLWRLGGGLALSAVVGVPVILRYVEMLPFAHLTGLQSWPEPSPGLTDLASRIGGPLFFHATLLGAVLAWSMRRRAPIRSQYLVALAMLLGSMAVLSYGVQKIALLWRNPQAAPLSPHRFLTYAVVMLSVFPAMLLSTLRRVLSASTRLVAFVIVGGSVVLYPDYALLFVDDVSAARRQAYAWIRTNTPERAMVIDGWVQAAYLSWRTTPHNPLPSSEFWKLARNRMIGHAIAFEGRNPAAAGRPVVWIRDPNVPAAGEVLWRHPSGVEVVRLWPPGPTGAPAPGP